MGLTVNVSITGGARERVRKFCITSDSLMASPWYIRNTAISPLKSVRVPDANTLSPE